MQTSTMGAIYTNIKLTNAIDAGMIRRGVLAPRYLRHIEKQALVDTGAVTLVIPQAVADQLGLEIIGQELAKFANGEESMVGVTEPIIVECQGRTTTDGALVVGDMILVGQVILEKLDLLADCRNQQLIANPAHPERPIFRV
jgi:clan AA aspartic protease